MCTLQKKTNHQDSTLMKNQRKAMLDRKKGRVGPGFSEKYGSEMLQSAKCNTFGRVESLGAFIKTQHEKNTSFLVITFFFF